jgi:cobalt-zinc-cadmium efflux system membrane fusion protein
MNSRLIFRVASCAGLSLLLAGCEKKSDPASEVPQPVQVESTTDSSVVKVDHPDQFPLVAAVAHSATSQLKVTGVVSPDVSQSVPIMSLAHGRIAAIYARLGDNVKKGQLLFKIQSPDISAAVSTYHKAVADEHLAAVQFERQKLLFDKGAVSKSALEIAENGETDAQTALTDARNQLVELGTSPDHASDILNVYAPVSGVITEQNITQSAGVKTMDNSPNLFTISNLSHVWIICDVYESDMPNVRVGQTADIRLNAYPDKVLTGKISDIGPMLDPNIRTAKVRIQVENSGIMRLGMFVTATFHGKTEETHAAVPTAAVLHLHDRDWVYVPAGNGQFKRVSVVGGNMLPGGLQEIASGIQPGQQVVSNALSLQSTVEQ